MTDPSQVHKTLAANRLDPSIEADGHMNAGQGVGGTSDRTVVKEGVEHVKQQNFENTGSTLPSSMSQDQSNVHQEGIDHIRSQTFGSQPTASHATTSNALGSEPPRTNPGVDDASAGLGRESGGVSNTANIQDPNQTGGMLGNTVGGIKSYLGFGSTQAVAQDTTPGYGTTGGVVRSDVDGPVSELGNTSSTPYAPAVTSSSTPYAPIGTSNIVVDSAYPPPQTESRMQDRTSASERPTTEETRDVPPPDQRGVEDAETLTGADKRTEDTTDAEQAGAGPGDVGKSNKPPAAAGGHSGSIENKSSIPTAGGERLGEKHWGESKIVPDNPKPKGESGSGAGVSSKDGQPNDQVKDNTAANTGGATSGPNNTHSSSGAQHSDHQEKEGLVDKIKDKLHMGKK